MRKIIEAVEQYVKMNDLENISEIEYEHSMAMKHYIFMIIRRNYDSDSCYLVETFRTEEHDDIYSVLIYLGIYEYYVKSPRRSWAYLAIIPSILLRRDKRWRRWWRESACIGEICPPPHILLKELKYYDIYKHGDIVDCEVEWYRDDDNIPRFISYVRKEIKLDIGT